MKYGRSIRCKREALLGQTKSGGRYGHRIVAECDCWEREFTVAVRLGRLGKIRRRRFDPDRRAGDGAVLRIVNNPSYRTENCSGRAVCRKKYKYNDKQKSHSH